MQDPALHKDLTLYENLEHACRLRQPVTTAAHQVWRDFMQSCLYCTLSVDSNYVSETTLSSLRLHCAI